jgi:predicted esterase YcpF (UPF0227 family)
MRDRGLAQQWHCPALPHRPSQAIAQIEAIIAPFGWQEVTVIGSSLGGFYATWCAEQYQCRAVLIQPAVLPQIGLAAYLGPQQNLYTGAQYELTATHLEELRALEKTHIDPERYLLLLETGDEVLDYRDALTKYAGARTVVRQGGDHSLQCFAEMIPRVLHFAGMPQA